MIERLRKHIGEREFVKDHKSSMNKKTILQQKTQQISQFYCDQTLECQIWRSHRHVQIAPQHSQPNDGAS